jgi:UDP-N-acetylglucosamine 4,6-dehydratase
MANILVTGGAGFLGRAILRDARDRHPDWRFTIYSRDEGKQAPVRAEFPEHNYVLGDVRDLDHLTVAMMGHDMVIHAAAFKYVPQAETQVGHAVAVNITGSQNVATAAIRARVERVVGISTDKACRAINVYGLTKRVMERLFQEADTLTDTRFNCVRYGNVIGSTGSVIPFFLRQAKEGRITLTNPDMTRFWLSVERAVELIMRAMRGTGDVGAGTIIVPRLAATDMETVAKACALAAGVPQPEFATIGHRHGEKVHEDLLAPEEVAYADWDSTDRIMHLYAPTAGATDEAARPQGLYTSATPDHWLGVDEMAQMIREGMGT